MVEEELFKKYYKKIKKILDYADTSEYYHDLFVKAGIDLSQNVTYENFRRIPTTEKKLYEKHKFGMITSRVKLFNQEKLREMTNLDDRFQYFKKCGIITFVTSGSTGQPLEVIKSQKDVFRDYVTLNENRIRMTNYNFSGYFVQVWPVNEAIFKKYSHGEDMKEFEQKNERGFMYFLCEHSEENLMKLYHFLFEKKCEWITSSPTVLYKLAKLILDKNMEVPNINYVECHSEKLYDWQKEIIYEAFRCDITSIYSSNEVHFISGECKYGKMHLFEKSCFLEIVPDENGNNEILLTSLNYCDIPIIRYKIGDCGKWCEEQNCNCEFSDYHSFEIYGFRKNDYIKTKQGDLEPFLIADAVYALAHESKIYIRMYRAVQIDYNKFVFYIPQETINANGDVVKNKIEEFLKVGLQREDIEVSIDKFNLDDSTYFSRKFRYFESQVQQ